MLMSVGIGGALVNGMAAAASAESVTVQSEPRLQMASTPALTAGEGVNLVPVAPAPTSISPSIEVGQGRMGQADFWPQAAELVRQQHYWAYQAEQSLAGVDPNAVRVARGRIVANAVAVEQFLKRQYPFPNILCGTFDASVTPNAMTAQSLADLQRQAVENASLSSAQTQAYCQLRTVTQRLESVVPILERRVLMLSDVAEVRPVTLPSEPYREATLGIPVERRFLSQPATPRFAQEPAMAQVMSPVLDGPQKDAIANYEPPMQPAVAPPRQATVTLQAVQQQLQAIQALFPPTFAFTDPALGSQIDERNAYEMHPREVEYYSAFVTGPGRGMTRILTADAHHRPANVIRNRAIPSVLERYPFDVLTLTPDSSQPDAFVPRLALQVKDDTIQVFPNGLDYGFMADLGDVPLEQVTLQSSVVPEFFVTYRPPTQLAALQTDQRQFLVGRQTDAPGEQTLQSQLPLRLNHTYVARLVQYELPEAIASQRRITPQERARLNQVLAMNSADVLVAFRAVNRRSDGSYTVLWQVLQEFPDPVVQDLDDYVRF